MKEDFEWVKQCIESCTNLWQFESAMAMVRLFEQKHYIYNRDIDALYNIAADKQARIIIK